MTASTMVLIFSLAIFRCGRYYSHFFWIISPSQAYLFSQRFCLSSSFSPPLGSPLRPPSLALIRSIPHTLPFSSNFSSALFLTGQRALSLSYSADVAGRLRGCGWGWRAAPHILSAYQSWGPVCSIPLWSISQPLSQCGLPRSPPAPPSPLTNGSQSTWHKPIFIMWPQRGACSIFNFFTKLQTDFKIFNI